MYYGNDDTGHIVSDFSSDVLPDEYADIYPSVASDSFLSGFDFGEQTFDSSISSFPDPETVSDSDAAVSFSLYAVDPDSFLDYDDLVSLLSEVTGYNVFPNTNAVKVFEYVLNGLDKNVGYFVLSGSDTYTTYLYYSEDYQLSGNSIQLSGDVVLCTYRQYRVNSSSPWQYTYTVSHVGSISVTPDTELVYTNLLEGYPDIIPYKSKESFSLLWSIPVILVCIALAARFAVRRGHV